jgi:phage-related protein
MPDKALWWLGSSRDDMRAFPEDPRQHAGFQLRRVQQGLEPNDWRPMPTIGPGIREIRIHTAHEYRVIYIAKFAEAVYVVHAFEKRSRKTLKRDLELARYRMQQLLRARESRGWT